MEGPAFPSLDVEGMARVRTYMESIIWVFIARLSGRSPILSVHEEIRFVSSLIWTRDSIALKVDSLNSEMDLLKYWFNRYMCQVFRVDLKDYPEALDKKLFPRGLFGGWCRCFIARAIARRDLAFVYSLAKGSKLAWPQITRCKQKTVYMKHADRLSRETGFLPPALSEEIRRTSREIFHGLGWGSKFMPTSSSCLQANRRTGGALSLTDPLTTTTLRSYCKSFGALRGTLAALDAWRRSQYTEFLVRASERLRVDDSGDFPALAVNVAGVTEPGKLRVVTSGDGYLYSALQPLQGEMLAAWKRTKYSSMLSDELTDPVENMRRRMSFVGADSICSGDFEAATDWLKREATLAALEGCRDHPLYTLAWYSLLQGKASYPKWTGVSDVMASEGQLMGHPLSFPLLCVINLACYRYSVHLLHEELSRTAPTLDSLSGDSARLDELKDLVLVNGDDILFPVVPGLYRIWRTVTSQAGLRVSVGKNFVSADMCQMNSQVFRLSRTGTVRVGYLNQRFLTGVNVKTGQSECTPEQLGQELSKMVRLCTWTACGIPKAFRRWGADWRGRFRPNWYLPTHLGGYGLDIRLGPSEIRVTREQRVMAARFIADPALTLYRRLGSVKAARWYSSTVRPRIVPGDYVPCEGEVTSPPEWEAVFQSAARACTGKQTQELSDRVVLREFKPEYRLRPMSLERLADYWTVQTICPRLPEAPHYQYLPMYDFEAESLRPTGFSSVIGQNGRGPVWAA